MITVLSLARLPGVTRIVESEGELGTADGSPAVVNIFEYSWTMGEIPSWIIDQAIDARWDVHVKVPEGYPGAVQSGTWWVVRISADPGTRVRNFRRMVVQTLLRVEQFPG